jgi:uncharacterized protein (DUF433 family)
MPELSERITIDAGVCGGRPCIRGLRIRVTDILDMLAGSATRAEILADYPYLEDEDITAALEYAATQWDHRLEVDVKRGKLDRFAEEAISDHNAGRVRKL